MDLGSVSQHDYAVVSNHEVARDIFALTISSSVAQAIEPGQFMNLQVPGDGSHILRLPLSFKHADAKAGRVEILYAVVGEGTRRLSQMPVGATSTLLGPCGRGWRLPSGEGRSLLVAGGIGLPPIQAAAELLSAHGRTFDVIVGARTSAMLPTDELTSLEAQGPGGDSPQVIVCTDDGSAGRRGFVTAAMEDLLSSGSYGQAYACGPQVMMASVAQLAQAAGIDCQVSLERMMGCGFGACSCCNVALVAGGYALCCQDGPVFDAKEVAW